MSIEDQIEAIITQRQEQARHIDGVIEKWKNLKHHLRALERKQQEYLKSISENNSDLAVRLLNIPLTNLRGKIDKELVELENVKQRLSRTTLNIGVVGRMRQGKSRLLQSLTGLTDAEIPTSAEGVCTRVLSKIFHDSNPEGRNEVEFHSYSSLQEILHLYFEKLGLEGDRPSVPDDLDNKKFPPPLPASKEEDANAKYLSLRLRKEYYVKYSYYKSLLNGSIRSIPKEQIRQYTTQIQGNDNNTNSEYLAVKELRIYCKFSNENELGKIGVIDLPGLGDDSVLDVELLIKTLKQDIDFILFVRRPDPIGDDWQESDRNMYQIARNALGNFFIKKCSSIVFNKNRNQEKESLAACKRFQSSMDSQGIKVSESVIADCTDAAEVKNEILIPLLNILTQNVRDVNNQYLLSHNQRLEELRIEIKNEIQKASKALEGFSEREGEEFDTWFDNEVWKPLTSDIFNKRNQLLSNKNTKDTQFESKVNEVLECCRKEDIIPSLGKISEFSKTKDSYKISYYMCIHEIKNTLTKKFQELAKTLEESEIKLQLSVVDILINAGRFKLTTSPKLPEFFQEIEEKIPGSNTNNRLKEAFKEIKKSTTTYQGQVNTWIQSHLDELKPDKHLDPISAEQVSDLDEMSKQVDEINTTLSNSNLTEQEIGNMKQRISEPTADVLSQIGSLIMKGYGSPLPEELNNKIAGVAINQIASLMGLLIDKINSPQPQVIIQAVEGKLSLEEEEKLDTLIHEQITSLRDKVVDKCEQTLQGKLSFPNEEAHSKFDKFITLAFTGADAQTAWRIFYNKNQAILWSGARQKEENKVVEQEWQRLVDAAIAANNEEGLQLQP